MVITLQDIGWLRLAAHKAGTQSIPTAAATKLINAQLIKTDVSRDRMRITRRGELALLRLG